jgi:Ca-activated chloride channel family protein
VALKDRVLRYEVTETFVNRSGRVAEADYVFPLPAGAAFEDLKLSINGELVSGETMSAAQARGIYEEIVRKMRDPALVEWMGQGMLRTRIFPIQPGEEKKVVVRFQSVAQREGDALRVDYRRGSDPTRGIANPVNHREDVDRSFNGEGTEWTTFSLLYEPGATYGEPYSPTHSLRSNNDGRTRLVRASGSAPDVTILLPLRRPNTASLSVLTHAPGGERGFALITITPPATSRRTLSRDVTFVVDVSGSMRGRKLQQAKEAGYALLQSLNDDDRLRVIDFSTDVRQFRDDFVPATRSNVRAATQYVKQLNADGSTNISGALSVALEGRPDGERLPLVVFITDGEPTVGERNPDRIAAMASQMRDNARVFAIGVSADVNATLIEQLAVDGGGTAHFVRNNESVESTVRVLATRLAAPVLTNVQIRADGVQLQQVLPAGPIDLFAGQDVIVLARYEGSGPSTVRLTGESVDGRVNWSTNARFADRTRDNAFVARLWATQRIGWLAAEKRRSGGNPELNDEIRSLGERFGIPTEFTSYLVVEPGMNVANTRDATGRSGPVLGSSPSRLQDAVVTGQGSSVRRDAPAVAADVAQAKRTAERQNAPAATSPVTENEARFEAARASAMQREAKSTDMLDAAAERSGAKRVANRTFTLSNGVWTDAGYNPTLRTVRVKPYSALYFALVQQISELGPVFALGDQLKVAGRQVGIELAADGQEQLSDREMRALVSAW